MSPERFNEISQMTVDQFGNLDLAERIEYLNQKNRGNEFIASVEHQRISQSLNQRLNDSMEERLKLCRESMNLKPNNKRISGLK